MVRTLAQLSDIHLSRARPFFQFNWEVVLAELARLRPDHVVVTGDLALNGPDDADDIGFARAQLDRLPCAWSAVPGNHDVGLVPIRPGVHQAITAARREAYLDRFGADRFAQDFADWTLLGLNTQLLGSGLAAEAEQHAWLEAALRAASGRPVALFQHYPLFRAAPDESAVGHSCVVPAARARIMRLLEGSSVQLIASGHLHREKRIVHAGITHQWAPATAFIESEDPKGHGGLAYNGFLLHRFASTTFSTERVEPRWMIQHDIRNWARSEPHGYYDIVAAPYLSLPTPPVAALEAAS
jgi:3',5'-cyclic AMP phosphodiesterase CpdA